MNEIFDPQRRLQIEGAHNVRDLGGYRTQDGGRTRWRRFLRTDSMHRLTAAAQTVLLEYGVGTIIDLRRTQEVKAEPNVFADSTAVQYHHLNMIGDEDLGIVPAPEDAAMSLQIAHSYYGYLDQCHAMVNRILGTLAAAQNQVALFHCASGKDRTGLIAALLLGLVGVPEETIIADYGLTAHYSIGPYLTFPNADAAITTWEDYQARFCPPKTMRLVLAHLARRYGGVEGYMRTVGLSQDQIDGLRQSFKG
jgi:protein-tyrosine phosphatase